MVRIRKILTIYISILISMAAMMKSKKNYLTIIASQIGFTWNFLWLDQSSIRFILWKNLKCSKCIIKCLICSGPKAFTEIYFQKLRYKILNLWFSKVSPESIWQNNLSSSAPRLPTLQVKRIANNQNLKCWKKV